MILTTSMNKIRTESRKKTKEMNTRESEKTSKTSIEKKKRNETTITRAKEQCEVRLKEKENTINE